MREIEAKWLLLKLSSTRVFTHVRILLIIQNHHRPMTLGQLNMDISPHAVHHHVPCQLPSSCAIKLSCWSNNSEGTTIYFNTFTPTMPDLEAYAPLVLTTASRVPRDNDRVSDTDLLTNKIKSLSMAD